MLSNLRLRSLYSVWHVTKETKIYYKKHSVLYPIKRNISLCQFYEKYKRWTNLKYFIFVFSYYRIYILFFFYYNCIKKIILLVTSLSKYNLEIRRFQKENNVVRNELRKKYAISSKLVIFVFIFFVFIFLLCICNMGAPPFISLIREVILYISMYYLLLCVDI